MHDDIFEVVVDADRSGGPPIAAQWSFKVIDPKRRLVAFTDESVGKVNSWQWDFGDGTTSTEQHLTHIYKEAGKYVVVLWVEGSAASRGWPKCGT